MSYTDTLHLVFLQPQSRTSNDEALDAMAANHPRGFPVANTIEMVGRAISTCILRHKRMGRLTFVGHGSRFNFHIGRESISEAYLQPNYRPPAKNEDDKRPIYYALLSLRPYFAPGAMVYVEACNCGESGPLLRALSRVLSVPVVGWTGLTRYVSGRDGYMEYDEGRMTVCISEMCFPPPE